ncbi:MAG: hypothetical protein GKR77_01440 [Legionellales bacterium]|nr:hypothetical protein [Legionellales bacterium]
MAGLFDNNPSVGSQQPSSSDLCDQLKNAVGSCTQETKRFLETLAILQRNAEQRNADSDGCDSDYWEEAGLSLQEVLDTYESRHLVIFLDIE